MNPQKLYEHLNAHDYTRLFVEELGWSHPASRQALTLAAPGGEQRATPVAELGGVVVLHVRAPHIPDLQTRLALHRAAVRLHREHLLIFTDAAGTQSLWFWVRHEDGKLAPRSHLYVRGQPADLFLSKLQAMQFELAELDPDGRAPVTEVAQRLKRALDVEGVTKKFFREFQQQHLAFLDLIEGIPDERDRRWYASVLLNRLMFVWFLQKKGFVDNADYDYLNHKFAQSRQRGPDLFYAQFLSVLFFEGFAKPEDQRSAETHQLLGKLRYLNGGLFLPHRVEQTCPHIRIPDVAFENLFRLFGAYSWNLDDRAGGKADEINPDVLGYIFEKYINQKAFGAYYTRPEITRYLCEQTIHRLILDRVQQPAIPELNIPKREFATLEELLLNLDAELCSRLLRDVLPTLSVLDPACGSGAFLVAAMKTLVNIYFAVIGRIPLLRHPDLDRWKQDTEGAHKNLAYHVHKAVITDNLYGVDIMEEAAEIARLRLFLALVACARTVDEIEPLPNIDFNILPGNSLIGLLHVDGGEFDQRTGGDLFRKSYAQIVADKNRAVDAYRHATSYAQDLRALRDDIERQHTENRAVLNEVLLLHFADAGVRFEQATWDTAKNKQGKPDKRPLRTGDITALKPFHWGYEFDQIMTRGGFDAILTNPPWEGVKPQAKEFFEQHSQLVTKKKMDIKAFEAEQARLLQDPDIRAAWLEYLSGFPHQSAWFRGADQFRHQSSIANGKKTGSDLNLYKLFTEQCLNLLRGGGRLGIVVPSGLYTDLGAKGLRELLFAHTRVAGLFGFENREEIFEGVHRSFKFIVLTCEKGGQTASFPAAFMRHDVAELDRFPRAGALDMPVELIRRLSPDSLSVMEFRTEADKAIAEKMLRFPLLGEDLPGAWKLRLTREFDMTNDSRLFKTAPGPGRLPLYEGKMIWQFDAGYAEPRYWVDEREGYTNLIRAERRRLKQLLRQAGWDDERAEAESQGATLRLGHEDYRLGFRDIAASTNERAMIATVLPKQHFAGNTLNLQDVLELRMPGEHWTQVRLMSPAETMLCTAVLNSFVLDWLLRQKITSHLNMFYVYQAPVPRLTADDPRFVPIVTRAARLICTTPAFDDLARAAGLRDHHDGATDPAQRQQLRAQLDGLVAHLYELTADEFAHILGTFPLVPEVVKTAASDAYRDVANGQIN